MSRAIPFIAGVVLTALVAYGLHQRSIRTDAIQVADAAIRPVESPTPPPGLPDFTPRRWHAVGGRIDTLGGRRVASATWTRGGRTVTFSRMADTDGLNDPMGSQVTTWGDLNVAWHNQRGQLRARTVLDGHQTVLTGTPASESLRRELMHLIVLAGGRIAQ
ncbi:hypothetical protein [Baekduia sp. Peel2402]|uniref:hypothetical protein n=1 Tax=Baekduia sp. Peel2402 TaxID=3458296 RepID=UPI00403EA30A